MKQQIYTALDLNMKDFRHISFWISKKTQRNEIGFNNSFICKILNRKGELIQFSVFGISNFEKVCVRKITFCFILLRKNYIFLHLCAFLKNMSLNEKFYNASDLEIKILRRVRTWVKKFPLLRFWLKIFFILSTAKLYPSPTKLTFHNVFLHTTMYSYNIFVN